MPGTKPKAAPNAAKKPTKATPAPAKAAPTEPPADAQAPDGGAAAGVKAAEHETFETFTGGDPQVFEGTGEPMEGVQVPDGATGVLSSNEDGTVTASIETATQAPVETADRPAEPAPAPAPSAPGPPILPRPAEGTKPPKGFVRVRNLTPWAGADFSFAAGESVDMPKAMAEDRAAAGLVALT